LILLAFIRSFSRLTRSAERLARWRSFRRQLCLV
jgi:hypothetical protein